MCGNRLDYSHALFCPSSHLQPPNDAASHFERLRWYRYRDDTRFTVFVHSDVSFDLDPKQLHTTYKSLQKQLHPDRFACRPEVRTVLPLAMLMRSGRNSRWRTSMHHC